MYGETFYVRHTTQHQLQWSQIKIRNCLVSRSYFIYFSSLSVTRLFQCWPEIKMCNIEIGILMSLYRLRRNRRHKNGGKIEFKLETNISYQLMFVFDNYFEILRHQAWKYAIS